MGIEDFMYLREIESAREGWFQINCHVGDCDWYTTGSENVCEWAGFDHLEEDHNDVYQSLWL